MKKEQNEALKARLDAGGFTLDEQILGTVCAEFKAAMAMQAAGSRGPMGLMASMALSSTFAKVMALSCKAHAGADKSGEMAHRVVAVSDIVSEVCEAQARKDCGIDDCEAHGGDAQPGEQPAVPGAGIINLAEFRRPTEAKDIN